MKISLVITFVTLFLISKESSAAPQSGSFSGRAVKFVRFVLYTNYILNNHFSPCVKQVSMYILHICIDLYFRPITKKKTYKTMS